LRFFACVGFALDLGDPALALERRNQVQNGVNELARDGQQAG
jgi:hypothetical protein